MTDLIDRSSRDDEDDQGDAGPAGEAGGEPASEAPAAGERRGRAPLDLDPPDRWALAALVVGAGLVHLAMAPSHLGESAVEGTGFLVAGWLQVGLAVAVLLHPGRGVLRLVAASSLVLIAAWAVSRTTGLPVGAHPGHPETVSLVDGAVVALEAVALAGAALALWRGTGALRFTRGRAALAVPVAALVLTTGAIASPQARDHAAGSHGDHAAGGDTGGEAAGAGHDHGEGGAEGAGEADDGGLSLLDNGHQHDSGLVELDAATQAELAVQLAGTRVLIERYPTVRDAEDAGYVRAGPFAPGAGAHYRPPGVGQGDDDGVIDPEDIDDPMLIFDGIEPEAPLAGFMYSMAGDEEPEGFAGPNDHWHYHTNVCIVVGDDGTIDTPLLADMESATEQDCTDLGGQWLASTGYMVHVWTVPGYESERGVFSEINPAITCPDGTYHMLPADEIGTRESACLNG